MPGARARPRRHGRDVCEDLSSTTAAPGCPRLPLPILRVAAKPYCPPGGLYIEAPRLGRGVADLGRTYAGSAGAPRQEAPGPERTPARTHADLRDTINRPNLRRGKGTNVTTRAARSTAVSFQTRAGAPPRPGCPATASADAAAARPAFWVGTWPGTLELDDSAPSAPTSCHQSRQI